MTSKDHTAALPALAEQATHFFAPLQREIDRAITQFAQAAGAGQVFALQPDMDFAKEPDRITLTVSLPGWRPRDLAVTLHDDVLAVSGERRRGRPASFLRSVRLPGGVLTDQITATLSSGVLAVSALREARNTVRKIPIKVVEA